MIGVSWAGDPWTPATRRVGPAEAAATSLSWMGRSLKGIGQSLSSVVSGGTCAVAGPVTVYRGTSASAALGADALAFWAAALSLMVGFMNLLPVPGLDGGHLASYALRALGMRPHPAVGRAAAAFGLAVIAGLTILGLASDAFC